MHEEHAIFGRTCNNNRLSVCFSTKCNDKSWHWSYLLSMWTDRHSSRPTPQKQSTIWISAWKPAGSLWQYMNQMVTKDAPIVSMVFQRMMCKAISRIPWYVASATLSQKKSVVLCGWWECHVLACLLYFGESPWVILTMCRVITPACHVTQCGSTVICIISHLVNSLLQNQALEFCCKVVCLLPGVFDLLTLIYIHMYFGYLSCSVVHCQSFEVIPSWSILSLREV